MDRSAQLVRGHGWQPRSVGSAPRAHLGHYDEIVGVGRERLADEPVCDMRTVEVAGVDMIHAKRDRLAQHGESCVVVFWRSKHARAGKLHGAITKALHMAVAQGEGARLVDHGHAAFPHHITLLTVGRTTISFTSTSVGCSRANRIARAMASAPTIPAARKAATPSCATGSVIVSASSDSVGPGDTTVARMLSCSCRMPSVIAQTAYLVAQ